MKKVTNRRFGISYLILPFLFACSENVIAQIKEVNVPSVVDPGGGGGPVPDDSTNTIHFQCNLVSTNPCNLIRNSTFSLSCSDS